MRKIRDCLFPEDVLYDSDRNVWVKIERDAALIGIDTVLAWLSGPISTVSFKDVGTLVDRGNSLGSVEGPRHFDTVRSPLTGRVVEANPALIADPKLLNRDPYGRGWFLRLKPSKLEEEMPGLLAFDQARQALETKISDLKVRCFAEFPDLEMFEIGTECSGVLLKLDEVFDDSPVGTVVHLVSDDVTAEVELTGWSDRTHQEVVETRKEANLYHFIIKKTR